MKALHLTGPLDLKFVEIPVPSPGKGEVLVKMDFSPVNPSDLAFLTGGYGIQKPYPVVPGIEGSGKIVASGGGVYTGFLKNKRVACVASHKYDGTWAEYMVTEATKCIILKSGVSSDQGSMLFVNPLTALEFVKMARQEGFNHIVMTAAASSLSKMVIYFAQKNGIGFTGIVRKKEQISGVLAAGANYVFDSSSADYEEQLKKHFKGFSKILYPDAIGGGDIPYKILACLPEHSKMLIYGRLEQSFANMIPQDLIFHEYKIEGFWLNKVAGKKSLFEAVSDTNKVQKMLNSGFETTIQNTFGLEDFSKALKLYMENMSVGKVLFQM